MPTQPHDAIFKAVFGQPDLARSELELLLPLAIRQHLDLATLKLRPGTFVDEALQQTHADLLYSVQTRSGNDALVYIVLEHKSTFDPSVGLQLLRGMVGAWTDWERSHPASKLPILLPVVLSHDPKGWRSEPEFGSMLDANPELLAVARPFLPLFRFVLDDLGAQPLEAVAARDLNALALLVELALWASRSRRRLHEVAPRMGAISGAMEHDARVRLLMPQLYIYIMWTAPPDLEGDELQAILKQIAGPRGQEELMNAAEKLIEQGRAEGLRAAEKLVEQGRAEVERAAERGRVEGLRVAITTTLSARGLSLSENGRARLNACVQVETLTRWLTRAVTAASEAEVFEGGSGP
jgi:hypothetical protein